MGALYLVSGVFLIENPAEAAMGLTFLVAVCLLVGGTFRIVVSSIERFDRLGWALLNGVVPLLWEWRSGGTGHFLASGSSAFSSGSKCCLAACRG
jgi:hypothetical protein